MKETRDIGIHEDLPKVSIIIPVYNGSNYLKEAIDSALGQDYPNVEVIVVNDGSTDDGLTESIAKEYGNRIRYFYKENGGVATALNFGIARMTGEYFSWLSHDDLYFPGKISREIEAVMQLEDKTRVVCCGYHVVNENKKFLYEINPVKEYGREQLERPLFPVFMCCINGCALLIHKSHFERVGCFDETLPTTQDYDLWFRILRGNSICFIDEPLFYSRSHGEQDSLKRHNEHLEECNTLWLRLFKELTKNEKEHMHGSEFSFVYKERKRFLDTEYKAVSEYLDMQMRELLYECAKVSNKEISEMCLCLLELSKENFQLREEMEQCELEAYDYAMRYKKICDSTSWKITKPFRLAIDFWKKIRNYRSS